MTRTIMCTLALAATAAAADPIALGTPRTQTVPPVSLSTSEGHPALPAAWKWSAMALSVGTALDVSSSWGHYEANRIVPTADGRFGWQGAAVKVGFAAGTIALQRYVLRRHPQSGIAKVFTAINFGVGTQLGVIGARNFVCCGEVRP